MPDLIVTNFNRNFTGVSSTAAAVIRQQVQDYDLRLSDIALPGCPSPITRAEAKALSRTPSNGRSFTIWHVRRNPEMRVALWARDVLKLPIKIVFTSAAQRRHSAYPRWLISKMDAVIATTENAASFVPNVRAVVPHGVDIERFQPAPDRAAAWAATGYPGKRGIATIGRIRPEKGTDRFIDAMLKVLPKHPAATALIIGRAGKSDIAFLDTQKAKIAQAGLNDRIVFTGEIPADDLVTLLPSLSAVVQLPLYEGYGMTPLEGMASGVPFVASDAGYYRSFSCQSTTGVVVDNDDIVQSAASQLDAILGDPDRHAKMSNAARVAAQSAFSIRGEAEGINAVYEQLWAEG
ncbi:GDP-mannose-dependent alpha-(1-6)-phosphatidylinositol monomannoside mannosyltransferase [Roseovarius albus]|uniref:GDP-mannose-dependent alpha-(1-6)-phosphatidylinositol monomannoside mannosyltransferase n=1 Tax=Roseovarius albus TaxID=1247867 RepID=A0A1X6ZEJ0_9RHOB|nr:glycosyltransferase family 4 protein [Roseovarius albus]SLN49107.1 GDP-mannose-dependent alpha-(1-6)-phosphatidylinositol monomannoside mannosyltransferase [Roseovarius albus]